MERALFYKSSKVHLRYFGETTTDEMRAAMLAGIGENAGVVDIGDWLGGDVQGRGHIITRPASRPTRARLPEWAASCGTSWRWVRVRSR